MEPINWQPYTDSVLSAFPYGTKPSNQGKVACAKLAKFVDLTVGTLRHVSSLMIIDQVLMVSVDIWWQWQLQHTAARWGKTTKYTSPMGTIRRHDALSIRPCNSIYWLLCPWQAVAHLSDYAQWIRPKTNKKHNLFILCKLHAQISHRQKLFPRMLIKHWLAVQSPTCQRPIATSDRTIRCTVATSETNPQVFYLL